MDPVASSSGSTAVSGEEKYVSATSQGNSYNLPSDFTAKRLPEWRLAAFEKQADVFAAAAEAAQATLAARVVGQFEFGLPFRAGRDALANHQHCKCSGRIVCRSRARGLPIGRPDRAGGGYRDLCARYWGLPRTVTVRAVRSWRRRAPYWCRSRTIYTAGIW